MKVLYFDCFSGISGDMTMGALLDLGIDQQLFLMELAKLNLHGYEIKIERKSNNGILGTDVKIVLHESHHQNHIHAERNLNGIELLIDSSCLKQNVKELSRKVFREIAAAEAKVHNKSINDIHFHEVGAVDSIVDIVGVAICIDMLDVKKIFSSPLHDGYGFIECQHGTIPVPVPAVMEMLKDSQIPLISEDINTELITPTGMGLIKCLASSFGNMPAMLIDRIGYGMGKRDTGKLNALRVVVGTLFGEDSYYEEISVLETNIDDMSAEILSFTAEQLLKNGALDVFYTPIYMKKNRPAVMLTVLTDKGKEEKMVDIMLKETSTLGVRRSMSGRVCMDREVIRVDTDYGEVRVKVATKGDIKKFSPEYEDCREMANKTGMSIKDIYEMVTCAYQAGN